MQLQTDDIIRGEHAYRYYMYAENIEDVKKIRERWHKRGHDTIVRGGTDQWRGKILIFVENLQ